MKTLRNPEVGNATIRTAKATANMSAKRGGRSVLPIEPESAELLDLAVTALVVAGVAADEELAVLKIAASGELAGRPRRFGQLDMLTANLQAEGS